MLTLKDYADALDAVGALLGDFVHSATIYETAPNTPEGKEFKAKSAYISTLYSAVNSLNYVRNSFSNNPNANNPRPNYNPRFPNRLDGDENNH